MSVAAIERQAVRGASTVLPAALLAGLSAWLLFRLAPDVTGKPLHEDEAVAGLVAARPFGDMLHTVVLDRGGAPLHFLLAHAVFSIDASPAALRWLSLVFAVATLPLCYDLARRLAGPIAGVTAAAFAATSQLLAVYGTFGRMYSLFAFASALAIDLFVRALDRPSNRTATAAAAAALLPLAVHPFGVFLFGAEALVAAWLWRARDWTSALPALAVASLAIPLVLADLRLSDRYTPEAGHDLTGGYSPATAAVRALGGATGGRGVVFAAFAAVALAGAVAIWRKLSAFVALAVLAILAPPLLLGVAAAVGATSDRLGPRHLIFTLPLWTALAAIGVARLAATVPGRAGLLAPVAAIAAAALAPAAVSDPRTIATGGQEAVRAPATWLRAQLRPGDVFYPYSPLFLAALPAAASARGYPREPVALERALARTSRVGTVFVSLPLSTGISSATFERLRATGVDAVAFPRWLILRAGGGPFEDGREALKSAADTLGRAGPLLAQTPRTHAFVLQLRGAACEALAGC
jgi:Dolichyl-phosphate-mannose-protein mannosyltransferase